MVMLEEFTIAIKLILNKTAEIIEQPILNKDMLWILLPLLTALFLMELYFGRYKEEELGWNSAVSNSIVLFFVGMNLCSFLYSKNMLIGITTVPQALVDIAAKKTFIAFFILLESVFFIALNFFHLVSRRFAFGISSALIMNYLGVISIVLVYSNLSFDFVMIPAILLLFIITVLFFLILQMLIPKKEETDEEVKEGEGELNEIEQE